MKSTNTKTKQKDSKNINKSKLPIRLIIISGISVLLIILTLGLGVGGYVGYRVYQKQKKANDITKRINRIHDAYKEIPGGYEDLLKEIDGNDTLDFPADKKQAVLDKITATRQDLNSFKTVVSNEGNESDGSLKQYTMVLQEYIVSIEEFLAELRDLVGFASCYTSFSQTTSQLGKQFASANETDIPAITLLYRQLLEGTTGLKTCLVDLKSSNLSPLIVTVEELEKQTNVVIEGIQDNSLTQTQVDEFLKQTTLVQEQIKKSAALITTSLEDKINKTDDLKSRLKNEEQELVKEYGITLTTSPMDE